MRLADYLMMKVSPLYLPEELPKTRRGNPKPDHNKANEARSRKCQERFMAVLPEGEWVPGTVIAERLGTAPANINKTLYSFRERGLVESRRTSSRGRALEWRWT